MADYDDNMTPDSFDAPLSRGPGQSPDEAIIGPAFTLLDAGLLGAPPSRDEGRFNPFATDTRLERVPEAPPLRMPFDSSAENRRLAQDKPFHDDRRRDNDGYRMLDQEYPYPSGGGSASVVYLTVQEQDGSPSVVVSTIKVPNGTLTDEGNGVVSLTFSSTLQQAYNNGSAGVDILTDATRLGVTIKRGSAADTDAILNGQNGAGTDTFVVKGDGTLWVGQATGYSGIAVFRVDDPQIDISLAAPTIAIVNQQLVTDNYAVLEFAGLKDASNKGSFGRIGSQVKGRGGSGATTDFVFAPVLGGTFLEGMRLVTNPGEDDCALLVNIAPGYGGGLVAAKTHASTNQTTAPPVLSLVNENTTNDNWVLVEYSARATDNVRFGYGRTGMQIRNHLAAARESDFVISPITAAVLTERLRISGAAGGLTLFPSAGGHAVFNENGVDADFRVEGDTVSNALHVDASIDSVIVGKCLFVGTTTLGPTATGDLVAGVSGAGQFFFDASNPTVTLYNSSGSASIILWAATGVASVFNEQAQNIDFRVEGTSEANLVFVDASANVVSFGSGSPSDQFRVSSTKTFTSTDGGSIFAGYASLVTHTPSGASGSLVYGYYATVDSTGSNSLTDLGGGYFQAMHVASATLTSLHGVQVNVLMLSANDATNCYGFRSTFAKAGSGTTTNAYGFYVGFGTIAAPLTNYYGLFVEEPPVAITNRFGVVTNGGTSVFNENGGDFDFRIEGDTDANLLFLDASVDFLGVGTGTPAVKLDVNGGLATRATSPATITADQNDYAIGAATFFRLATDAQRTITGMTGGVDGKHLILRNIGSFNLVLAHQSGSSSAANRIITGTAQDLVIAPDETAVLIYDATTQRWQVMG